MDGGLNPDPRIVVPEEPDPADRSAILSGLAAYNREHADLGHSGPLAVLLKDAVGATIGGLWGATLFRWLNIELVFVPEAMRGASVGTALLGKAESLAAERGCVGAALDTYVFQARGFYEKLGYSVVGTIADCPPGGERYFLQKRFRGGW
jgi:GNAT superfamily N-acetyltransferase